MKGYQKFVSPKIEGSNGHLFRVHPLNDLSVNFKLFFFREIMVSDDERHFRSKKSHPIRLIMDRKFEIHHVSDVGHQFETLAIQGLCWRGNEFLQIPSMSFNLLLIPAVFLNHSLWRIDHDKTQISIND